MAFDQASRNRLQHFVSESRDLLREEFSRQLESVYGIDPGSGMISELESLVGLTDTEFETARILRDTIQHYRSSSTPTSASEAADRVIREQAFTVLNRLSALRMAEVRGFIVECVGKGTQSSGFQMYVRLSGGAIGEQMEAYRSYLFGILDEFSLDLAILFDRYSPMGRLFPRSEALGSLIELLDGSDIAVFWPEDETIGWIYQYFNSKEERKKMREESAGPRNSRELAVRNQFFTPRYVVEFLTDNTLGRMWYEMRQGDTSLQNSCRYLVRRPNEVFLSPGETAPAEQNEEAELSQDELLRKPVYIKHRPRKDPRDLHILDPACGSGHFLLYAFDLLDTIYQEAWTDEHAPASEVTGRCLSEDYPTHDAFRSAIPKLVVEYNLHGIDIDPRCAQIAGLSLWLRAQRSWHAQGLGHAARPRILSSNIVCAEPMPGEKELLKDFVESEFTRKEQGLFLRLLERIRGKMQLAGEAGSLLKIEEEISAAIEEAKDAWNKLQRQSIELFSTTDLDALRSQKEIDFSLDLRDLRGEFFHGVEARIYAALRSYAAQAEGRVGIQRRLFANDTAQGFAFVDLCRKRYDVVLMNPPFGEITVSLKDIAARDYQRSKADILCMFVERATQLLAPDCFCAAITNRTPFFTDRTEGWRESFFLGGATSSLRLFADLGHKVLDSALVETAAYSLARVADQGEFLWFNVTQVTDKESALQQLTGTGGSIAQLKDIQAIPGKRLSYWLPRSVVHCYSRLPSLAGSVESVDKGMSTTDDFRFIRACWEVPNAPSNDGWMYYAKGGEYSPFASDIHLTVNWKNGGQEYL